MKFLLGFLMLVGVQGWMFQTNDEQQAVKPVDDSCLAKADALNCDFWDCFEERHPCSGFIINRAKSNCLTVDRNRPRFDDRGKEFLVSSRRCLMQSFKGLYLADHLSCSNLSSYGYKRIGDCSLEATPSICDVYWPNKDHFTQGFDFNLTVLRHIAKMFMKCGRSAAARAIQHFTSKVGLS
ncbi:uncharacterized protein LOC141912517 [Tubulanus polymorphus]|uniref:uncharacterized protein LOC141912517 n=1 Tax=Tubulanus polymorphus TaxID=672921 RepID=UPI003DA3F661